MSDPAPRTAIICVPYNHRRFLAGFMAALERARIEPGTARLFLVDNASSDGTADYVRDELLAPDGRTSKGGFPCVFIANRENRGFSGGNNQAMRTAVEEGYEYIYLLNPDTEAAPGFLDAAIAVAEADPLTAIVQSQLRLHPRVDLVNSWGNEIHFLGFGFAGGESVPADSAAAKGKLRVREIAYASGAGMLIKVSALKKIGLLDEDLFAFHEDLELSWRARLAGYKVMLAPESLVFHKYEFSRSIKKYYWMERNRLLVMLYLYRLPTLILLAPAFLAMELGLWLFAFKSGWWVEKLRAYAWLAWPENWLKIAEKRRERRALRRVSDRRTTALFTGKVEFQQMRPWLLTRVANPFFSLYWTIARLVMFW